MLRDDNCLVIKTLVPPSDLGIPPPPPPTFPVGLSKFPPPPPPPDSVSMVSSGGGSSVHGYAVEPDWVPKSYLEKSKLLGVAYIFVIKV